MRAGKPRPLEAYQLSKASRTARRAGVGPEDGLLETRDSADLAPRAARSVSFPWTCLVFVGNRQTEPHEHMRMAPPAAEQTEEVLRNLPIECAPHCHGPGTAEQGR